MVNHISAKSISHFLNYARPNPGLYVDEFVMFVICLPIIDLASRTTGERTTGKHVFATLYGRSHGSVLKDCESLITTMMEAGFSTIRQSLAPKIVEERLHDYAAAYRMDQDEEHWTYQTTCRLLAARCLTPQATNDTDGFIGLMEDVVDRTRGRVKREFTRSYSNVIWMNTTPGRKRDKAPRLEIGTSATIYTWPGRDDR